MLSLAPHLLLCSFARSNSFFYDLFDTDAARKFSSLTISSASEGEGYFGVEGYSGRKG
jgi:hypothetical protein